LTRVTRANGTTRQQVYDAAGQLRFIEERGPAPTDTLLWMRALEYDADGRITKTYTYPSSVPVSTPAANEDDTATHDADNRIATWSAGTGGTLTCQFDDDGNLLSGPLVHSPSAASPMAFAYDHHNRLTGAGGQANLYKYNPDGHRIEADGVAYVIDPNAALSRTLMRVNGSTTTYYLWGATGLEYEITGSTTKTYHPDHLGSTMLLTNAAGTATGEWFEYDSYGTPTHVAGNPTTPFRWHGTLGVTTDPNGLVHMRARFYPPRIMRVLNPDPIGFEGGMNWFAFVGNNPLGFVDPLGLCPPSKTEPAFYQLRAESKPGDYFYPGKNPGESFLQFAIRSMMLTLANPSFQGAMATGGPGSNFGGALNQNLSLKSPVAAENVTVQFGKVPNQVSHTFRHIEAAGLQRGAVQAAVESHLKTVSSQIQVGKPFNQIIEVGGQKLQYTAYKLSDETINVGRIHPVDP
jgi:RHS repeat-associated protein